MLLMREVPMQQHVDEKYALDGPEKLADLEMSHSRKDSDSERTPIIDISAAKLAWIEHDEGHASPS